MFFLAFMWFSTFEGLLSCERAQTDLNNYATKNTFKSFQLVNVSHRWLVGRDACRWTVLARWWCPEEKLNGPQMPCIRFNSLRRFPSSARSSSRNDFRLEFERFAFIQRRRSPRWPRLWFDASFAWRLHARRRARSTQVSSRGGRRGREESRN